MRHNVDTGRLGASRICDIDFGLNGRAMRRLREAIAHLAEAANKCREGLG